MTIRLAGSRRFRTEDRCLVDLVGEPALLIPEQVSWSGCGPTCFFVRRDSLQG